MRARSSSIRTANIPPRSAIVRECLRISRCRRRPKTLTMDTPVPFSIKKLWYELAKFERMTFPVSANQTDANLHPPEHVGDLMLLKSDWYAAASPHDQTPFKNQKERNLERQLELMRSRLKDARFSFLFTPGGSYEPDSNGEAANDLNTLVKDWVGHDKPITIF